MYLFAITRLLIRSLDYIYARYFLHYVALHYSLQYIFGFKSHMACKKVTWHVKKVTWHVKGY